MNLTALEKKLKIYGKEGYNVLLTGKHGVGKTALIKSVFGELFGDLGRDWLYFSASTLDPWVDFIGIPKNYTRPDGTEVFKLIPPEHLAENNEIKAVFFDEINRAESEKILNAIMELIQFKSINGRKFEKLRCVWAAENPSDDASAYSVKPLDPAQRDRFQIQIVVPQELNKDYFVRKYDDATYSVAETWWTRLPADKRSLVSPRKLDDMLEGFKRGFDLKDFTTLINVNELSYALKSIHVLDEMLAVVVAANSSDEVRNYFTLDRIRKNDKVIKQDKENKLLSLVFPHLDEEVQAFIEKEFQYNNPNKQNDLDKLTSEQTSFVSFWGKKPKIKFADFNVNAINTYINEFNKVFKTINPKKVNYYTVVVQFPFLYDPNFSTNYIRNLMNNFTVGSDEEVKHWICASMYMITNSYELDNQKKRSNDLFSILAKLVGNKDFSTKYKINKIFFNEWKRRFPLEPFEVYQKRTFA